MASACAGTSFYHDWVALGLSMSALAVGKSKYREQPQPSDEAALAFLFGLVEDFISSRARSVAERRSASRLLVAIRAFCVSVPVACRTMALVCCRAVAWCVPFAFVRLEFELSL